MTAAELHVKLSAYLAQAPQNAYAQIGLMQAGTNSLFGLAGANDAIGMVPDEHLLIFMPDTTNEPISLREIRAQ